MCIVIAFLRRLWCHNFWIQLYLSKTRQKFKYLVNKKSLQDEIKSIFHHFKGFSAAKHCLRPESAPLIYRNWVSSYRYHPFKNKPFAYSFFFFYMTTLDGMDELFHSQIMLKLFEMILQKPETPIIFSSFFGTNV